MCGISGIITKNKMNPFIRKKCMQAMLDSIQYRGPDGQGIKEFEDCVLGHVRLSIIDLFWGGQPMASDNPYKWIVFNGEIYGFKDIKNQLTDYPFHTDCDTEVILALNKKYPDYKQMLKNLPGMFSFGIWDDKEKVFFAARDRFGEKPFYYAVGDNGEFIFASEIKAILASGLVHPKINQNALDFYIKHSWIYPTITIYENIHTLPPAHFLVYKNGCLTVERYWELPKTDTSLTLESASEKFEYLFKQAVTRQVVADVPIGAFLSGGLDSGSVVAAMSQVVPQVTTISFKTKKGFDESPLALSMSKKYNTNHIVADEGSFDIGEMLWKMQDIFDEPFADPASISAYMIAKEARKHVKVILSGDAGDEMMGGYATSYRSLYYANKMRESSLPLAMRAAFLDMSWARQKILRKLKFMMGADVALTVFKGTKLADTEIRRRAVKIAKNYPADIADYHRHTHMNFVSDSDLSFMHGNDVKLNEYIFFKNTNALSGFDLDNAVRCDLLGYLPGDGLLKTDRTTMAVSLESRTPFCDVDLAEFCISLPFELKVSDKTDKVVLRNSMKKYWTKEITNNIKTGFSPPWDKWMETDTVKEFMDNFLYNKASKIWSYLDYDFTSKFIKNNNGWPKWIFMNLGLWFEKNKQYL